MTAIALVTRKRNPNGSVNFSIFPYTTSFNGPATLTDAQALESLWLQETVRDSRPESAFKVTIGQ